MINEKKSAKIICIIGIAVILLAGLVACGSSSPNTEEASNSYQSEVTAGEAELPQNTTPVNDADLIMVFEGESVFENDLRFVAGIMGLDPSDKDSQNLAISQLIEFMTIINRANRHGFGITREEHEEMLPTAHMNVELMGLSGIITDERLIDFFAVGTLLSRLLDHYAANYTPDLTEYQHEFAEFAELNRDFLANIQVKYIANQDFDMLNQIREQLISEGTANFDNFAREHSHFYAVDGGAIIDPLNTFLQIFGLYDHDRLALFELQSGELSHIFYIEDFFFLVYVHSRTEATDSEIEDVFIQSYALANRADALEGLVETWVANAEYTINQNALDAMR